MGYLYGLQDMQRTDVCESFDVYVLCVYGYNFFFINL